MHQPRADVEHHYIKREKSRRSFNPTRIDPLNHNYRIKDIFRLYNRLDAIVSKHILEAKERIFNE